ncbi:CLUMA_CG001968, isoform A [Clunio marinus]|uniref:CLUMA_CG001968, isoform A n=1 Tax=Clunio marinus TaxID=568069 RepID=A0A1J1HJU5_9DIPT|nr:CLUMA_CG001968, isoform A [Clunio marinus]
MGSHRNVSRRTSKWKEIVLRNQHMGNIKEEFICKLPFLTLFNINLHWLYHSLFSLACQDGDVKFTFSYLRFSGLGLWIANDLRLGQIGKKFKTLFKHFWSLPTRCSLDFHKPYTFKKGSTSAQQLLRLNFIPQILKRLIS